MLMVDFDFVDADNNDADADDFCTIDDSFTLKMNDDDVDDNIIFLKEEEEAKTN